MSLLFIKDVCGLYIPEDTNQLIIWFLAYSFSRKDYPKIFIIFKFFLFFSFFYSYSHITQGHPVRHFSISIKYFLQPFHHKRRTSKSNAARNSHMVCSSSYLELTDLRIHSLLVVHWMFCISLALAFENSLSSKSLQDLTGEHLKPEESICAFIQPRTVCRNMSHTKNKKPFMPQIKRFSVISGNTGHLLCLLSFLAVMALFGFGR